MDTVRTLELLNHDARHKGSAYRVKLTFAPDDHLKVYLASAKLGSTIANDRILELRSILDSGDPSNAGGGSSLWSSIEDVAPTVTS
jgi:hypothetical protein